MTPETKTEYYIQRKPSGYIGNSVVWWAKGGHGYTSHILGAERFDEARALRMVEEDPYKWAAYKCCDVDARLHLVFDHQDVDRLGTAEPCPWDCGYAPHPNTRCAGIAQYENMWSVLNHLSDEDGHHFNPRIHKEELFDFSGFQKQECKIPGIKCEYVKQIKWEEDCFEGELAYPLGGGDLLVVQF